MALDSISVKQRAILGLLDKHSCKATPSDVPGSGQNRLLRSHARRTPKECAFLPGWVQAPMGPLEV